ncbi:glycosyltransferase [Dyella humicola]|uniref:glycosyltransferase n=1 Tax=Dyella humicola TaxID=2992126 RepID=UPI00224D02C9|nr:glycosyltransferase [Dyella humicola]
MARINLIAWDNNRGLSHDIRLLTEALRNLGHEVSFTAVGPPRQRRWWKSLTQHLRLFAQRLQGSREFRYDLSITLEHVCPDHLGLARRNAFIPNPEWFSKRDRRHLGKFDAVFTKTQAATALFDRLGAPAIHIGFQSTDCYQPGVARQPTFLHLAGASRMKGTERLLAAWRRHPEWPMLHVLQAPGAADDSNSTTSNIEHRREYVADIAEIRALQNTHVFQLCLSETEGWGHYIAEALSCAAVVLTCDAPPMNELVTAERGITVAASAGEPLNLATRYLFDAPALEQAVERCISMQRSEWEHRGRLARAWYLQNQHGFESRLDAALQKVL